MFYQSEKGRSMILKAPPEVEGVYTELNSSIEFINKVINVEIDK